MPVVIRRLIICLALPVLLLMAGCASVPMAGADLDAEAKKFQPEPGMATVYILRARKLTGAAIYTTLIVNGRIVGALGPGTYAVFSVPAGNQMFALEGVSNVVQQKVSVEPGKNYFLEVSMHWGWIPGGDQHLEPVSEEIGRKKVTHLKRVEITHYKEDTPRRPPPTPKSRPPPPSTQALLTPSADSEL